MFTIILFLVILSLLVVAHEWGHFAAARKFGMRVHEFGIGFPPRAIGFYRDPVTKKIIWLKSRQRKADNQEQICPGTVYSLNWLPLGGFCKIKGEGGEEANASDSFAFQAWWKRIIVLVAGVVMNILLAAVLLSVGLSVGIPADVSGGIPDGAIVVEPPAVIAQEVVKGSPAAAAGVRLGDKIVSINGEPVEGSAAFVAFVAAHAEEDLTLEFRRGKEMLSLTMRPAALSGSDQPKLGIVLADAAVIRYPWYRAIPQGFASAILGLGTIFVTVFLLIKNLVLGQGLAFDVSGPVGIAAAVGASARLGIQYLITITATISLSLAAMNILPIPALDGGRVVFVLIEKIFRKPVPMKYEQMAHTIGFILLLVLIVVVTGRDILSLVR